MAAAVAGGRLDVVPIGPDALPRPRVGAGAQVPFEANVEFVVTPVEFRDLIAGVLDPRAVQLFRGEYETLERFVRIFRIDTNDPASHAAEMNPGGRPGRLPQDLDQHDP
jgi:hypothetical protein